MSRTNLHFIVCLSLICLTAAVVPASAQHFEQIPSITLSEVAAGRNEVWGLQFPGGRIWRYNPTSQRFAPVAGSLSQIAVGGGSLLQPDQVWGVNGAGVFSFDLSTNAYTQHNPSGAPTYFNQIAVGEGNSDPLHCHPYEVWGLASSVPASSGLPYRYNFCTSQFELVELPSGSTVPFTHIATGGSDVWALDAWARIWHFDQYLWTWIQGLGGYDNTLQQIVVGVGEVWGLDGNGTVYRYDNYYGIFRQLPYPPYTGFAQIAAGGNGVWGLERDTSNNGYRFASEFDYFVPVGSFWTQVAVGSGAGVWVINSSDEVFTFVRP